MAGELTPLRIAQFFALPGASELVEAFSTIPPGPVRDSIVHHAQMLAQASGWRPDATTDVITRVDASSPGPFIEWKGPRPRPADTAGTSFAPPTDLRSMSREGQIVERSLRGETPSQIAADIGAPVDVVYRLKRQAREQGVVFPGDVDGQARTGPKKKTRRKAAKFSPLPLPEPPWWFDDPESPIWENPALLPGIVASPVGTMGAVGPHDRRTFQWLTRAATRLGMTLRQYIDQQRRAVRMSVKEGKSASEIAREFGTDVHRVHQILLRTGNGTMARFERKARDEVRAEARAAEASREGLVKLNGAWNQ